LKKALLILFALFGATFAQPGLNNQWMAPPPPAGCDPLCRAAIHDSLTAGTGEWAAYSLDVVNLSAENIFATDTLLNLRDSTNAYASGGVISNVAPGNTYGVGFGDEYLYYLRKLWSLGRKVLIVLAGDSTMEGDGVLDQIYKPQYGLYNSFVLAGMPEPDIVLMAVPGSTAKQWVQDTLPGQLALNPDVMIIRTLLNDQAPAYRDSAEYWFRQGLAMIRADGKDVDHRTCIIEMPNATSDSSWYLEIEPWVRRAARDYQCLFIDTYTQWRDWAASDSLQPDHTHPGNVLSMAIVGQMADAIVPRGISQMIGNNNFVNGTDSANGFWTPSTVNGYYRPQFQPGISQYPVVDGYYPMGGGLLTFQTTDSSYLQFNYGRESSGPVTFAIRQGSREGGLGAYHYPLAPNDTGLVNAVGVGNLTFPQNLKTLGNFIGENVIVRSNVSTGGASGSARVNVKDNGYRTGINFEKATSTVQRAFMYIGDNTGGCPADELCMDLLNTSFHVRSGASGTTFVGTFSGSGFDAIAYKVGGAAGVSGTCSSVTVVNGIVTGCTP